MLQEIHFVMNSYTICLYVEERVRGDMDGDWQNSMPITRFNKSRVHVILKLFLK